MSYQSEILLFFILILLSFYLSKCMEEKMEEVFRKYISFTFQGNLLPNTKMEKSSKPKISVIILMYNEQKNNSFN